MRGVRRLLATLGALEEKEDEDATRLAGAGRLLAIFVAILGDATRLAGARRLLALFVAILGEVARFTGADARLG